MKHFQCPFSECVNDYFVVFDSRQKALEHMQIKHKCTINVADSKLKQHCNDNIDPFTHREIGNYYENPFYVESYVKSLHEREENYIKTKKEILTNNLVEKQINKGSSSWNNQSNKYGKYNKYGKGYDKYTNDSYFEKNNNYKYAVKEYGEEESKLNHNNTSNYNQSNMGVQVKAPQKPILKIDNYASFFEQYYKEVKKYIMDKITSKDFEEKDIIIPKEQGYQLIVIIDKNKNEENAELKYLTNFGFGFSLVDEILNCFANTKGYYLRDTLSRIPLSKLLILYKYLNICQLKASGGFFRHGKY
jgi:hypothetical protein